MYQPYVDGSYYTSTHKGIEVPTDYIDKYLREACRHIDTLTYNRIVKRGFDNLAEFQKDIIQEVVCRQAEFEYENKDTLDSILSQYSINGVSMSFGQSWNVYIQNGIAIKNDLYALLKQTGLCAGRFD